MASLPLAGWQAYDHAGHMDAYRSSHARAGVAIASLASRIRETVGEMHYASTRLTALMISPEQSDQAPDTYAEFLFRTPGTLLHEPPARCR